MKYQLMLKRFDLDINKLKAKINAFSKGTFTLDTLTNRLQFTGELDIQKASMLDEIALILLEEKTSSVLKFDTLRKDLLSIAKKYKNVDLRVKIHSAIKISTSSLKKKLSNYLRNSSIKVDGESQTTILIELFKEKGSINYRIFSYKQKTKQVPIKKIGDITVLIENPRLKEEISDFLRLCLIFKLTFKVIHNDKVQFEAMLNNAKRETKGKLSNFKVEVLNNLSQLNGYVKIGFSKHANSNELDLIKFLRENKSKRLLFIFGNDLFGLSQEARDKIPNMFSLTQEKTKPLKSDQALSYILGIYSTLS
ncbi:MAG TPA: hypothetical protein VJH20_00315 [Candidatus Nanoarchaeia archaeon]|nr:hypothetical protein [Candidatus Nanoarchaeia archaeon]